MHPPVTTVNQNDHVAAAAYLMKRADATALIVTQAPSGEPIGIITEADISHAIADGKNPNDVRIYQLMTARPTVVGATASIRDAAGHASGLLRHLSSSATQSDGIWAHRLMPHAACDVSGTWSRAGSTGCRAAAQAAPQ